MNTGGPVRLFHLRLCQNLLPVFFKFRAKPVRIRFRLRRGGNQRLPDLYQLPLLLADPPEQTLHLVPRLFGFLAGFAHLDQQPDNRQND